MRLLTTFTTFLIREFKINNRGHGYHNLMLVVSLMVSILGFGAFTIKAFSTHSIELATVLLVSSIINIVNIISLKYLLKFRFSSYVFILTLMLSMIYIVFDSGRNGYGYIWFYAIPVVNISILGVRKGSIFSFLFLISLIIIFLFPEYYISVEYTSELKPRLLMSLFSLILLLLFREWTIDFFNKQRLEKDKATKTNLEFKRTAVSKLSNQIRFVTNEILLSIKKIRKNNPKDEVVKPVNFIYDSSLNLINIINSIGEFSEINLNDNEELEDYNLYMELESTINLFSSYKVEINLNIDKNIPALIHGNSMLIKQTVYNIIENFINSESFESNKIDIEIHKGAESWDSIELKYQIINILTDRDSYNQYKKNRNIGELYAVQDDIAEIEKMGLHSLFDLVDALKGSVSYKKSKYFSAIYFNQQLKKDETYKKATILESYNSNTILKDDAFVSSKKLNKMRVLIMEDNPVTQKSMMFTLDKAVKKIDVASNGKEGLELFNTNRYDLILLDMNMPIVDGYEVARRIRNIEQGTKFHIPIIAIISDFLSRDVDNIMASGVDEYMHKPLKISDLINKVNYLSSRDKKKLSRY